MKKHRDNPHRKARRNIIKWYVIISIGAFLAAVLLLMLKDVTGWKFLEYIFFAEVMIDSIACILLVPIIIYCVTLTKRANELDIKTKEEKEEAALQNIPITDTSGEIIHLKSTRKVVHVNKQHLKKEMGPWWSVISILFLLPPIGAVMMFYKLAKEPHKRIENSITVSSAGWVYFFLGIALAVFLPFIGADDMRTMWKLIVIPALFSAFGLSAVVTAKIQYNKGRLTAKCQKLIWIDAQVSIDEIAAVIHKSFGETTRLLQKLIDEGLLFSCYIDFQNREIVAPQHLPKTAKKCRHCGSTTVFIQNTVGICDYCGRILK